MAVTAIMRCSFYIMLPAASAAGLMYDFTHQLLLLK